MTEEKAGKARRDPIEKASGNLEKALETISKRLLEQIKDGETPSRELGELAKVMKQAVEIRQELQEERGGQPSGAKSACPGCIFVSCTENTSASSAAKLAAKSWVRQARSPFTFQLMSFI